MPWRVRTATAFRDAQHAEVFLEFQQLPFGDFWLNDQLIVERKTMRDFAVSLMDGRSFRQLPCKISYCTRNA